MGLVAFFFFFSSDLYHKVSTFKPNIQTQKQKGNNVTPGRIGTVMFFPKDSYSILQGKPKGWAKQTDYGTKL